ncbi:hypothetical protein DYGSA30_39550 [Dyella sp. GSA-30]|nr:hypothetical protein DYGSA30_39550 [Dyella sp. GSA-30]
MTEKVGNTPWAARSPSGQRLATAMAVIGPNGGGKTSLLKPLAFLNWFIADSFHTTPPGEPIPIKPHFTRPNEPVEFELDADDGEGTLWRYVLKATRQRVLHEAVYQKPKKKKAFSYVFLRDWDESTDTYAIKQKGYGFLSKEAKRVRPNASLISTGAQYGVQMAQALAGANLCTNINVMGRIYGEQFGALASADFHHNPDLRTQMEQLLRSWDLGLSGVDIRELPATNSPQEAESTQGNEAKPRYIAYGIHKLKDGSTHELPMFEESNGTRAAFVNLWMLLDVLSAGGIAVIDELESDMHPHMLEPLLGLFANPRTNPYQAQIIFTCHAAEVLNLLNKSQVMLVEKSNCESQAWRLDSMAGVRSQDNLYAKYMSGAYGAVPKL